MFNKIEDAYLTSCVLSDSTHTHTHTHTHTFCQASYFGSGDPAAGNDFSHYGLAAPIYTHFTSPIRRYADVVVHRLLSAAIGWVLIYRYLPLPLWCTGSSPPPSGGFLFIVTYRYPCGAPAPSAAIGWVLAWGCARLGAAAGYARVGSEIGGSSDHPGRAEM